MRAVPMIGPSLRFLALMGGLAILCGCESQRTVTHTESKIDFGQAWSQQVGDEKKMKEKYASGFEIRDGRAVASGEKENPFAEKKEFSTGDYEKKQFAEDGKEVSKKDFGGKKRFETKGYDKGTPARETGKRSFLERRDAGIDDEFATSEWAQAARSYEPGDQAKEQGKRFGLPGGGRGEAPISSQAQRINVDSSPSTPMGEGGGGLSTMSVDEVREMLNPEAFR